jgi:protein SCO1/2
MEKAMTRLLAVLAAVAVAAFLGWQYWLGTRTDEFASCGGGSVAGGAIGGPIALLDEAGAAVTDADLFNKPALVYFGYTFCPDVCPLDNVRNVEAMDILAEGGVDIATYFITVDPKRDTAEVMIEYTDNIHPDLVGLTGSNEQIKVAASAYKAVYRTHEDEGEFYLVDHTTFTYLMLPGGAFADFFKRDDTPEVVANRTACFLRAAE